MRALLLITTVMALTFTGCGSTADGQRTLAGSTPPPTHDIAIVIPEAEDGRLTAGTIVELIYPEGQARGHRHLLQRWDGQGWTDVYQILASDPDQPFDSELIEGAWAPADEELPVSAIGFEGADGGQFAIIPPPTAAGAYRICDEQRALCSAAFEVAD